MNLLKHAFSFEGSKETKILCENEDTSLYLSFAGDIHAALSDVPTISIVKSLK